MSRNHSKRMKNNLPAYYQESKVVNNLIDTEASEMNVIATKLEDMFFQFFVDTATWGLDRWEQVYGIPTNKDLSYDERRSQIKAKMRGIGTVTKEMLKNVVETYGVGNVVVKEDYSNYQISITFESIRGEPSQIEAIKENVSIIIPAHLAMAYVFVYTNWGELRTAGMTWGNMRNYTWHGIKNTLFV